jgi:hypothetical protein
MRCEATLDRPDMGVCMPETIFGAQHRDSPCAAEDCPRCDDDFLAEVQRRHAS